MTRHLLVALTALLVAASIPSLALAKGPREATIAGPGLDSAITVGPGEPGAEMWAPAAPVMELAEAAGFFPASFGQMPSPLAGKPPAGELGPRYVVTYLVPGPDNESDRIVQDIYPYAEQPVTYTRPGQPFFEIEETRGGWFVGSAELTRVLRRLGLPASPPTESGDSSFPWPITIAVLAVIGALAAVAYGLRVRRRSLAAPAS